MQRQPNRLTLEGPLLDGIVKMAEGNPGAATCMAEMITKKDYRRNIPGEVLLMHLDDLNLYGSKLYMLWNDCCNRNLDEVHLVIRNHLHGHLTYEAIHKQLDVGRAYPFTNLLNWEELEASIGGLDE